MSEFHSDLRNLDVANPARRKLLTATAATGLAMAAMPIASQAQEAPKGELSGRTAFITGGARGIGLGCAQELAKVGANIVLYDIASNINGIHYPLATLDDLNNAKATIEAEGVRCLAIQGDIRNSDQLNIAMQQTVHEFGSLDFLIANAAVYQIGLLDQLPEDEIQLVIDVNLAGTIKTVQVGAPIMREQKGGRIVIISSVGARAGNPRSPVYCTTKWGVIGLAKSTALIYGKYDVTCNAVCPATVNTVMMNNESTVKHELALGADGNWDMVEEFTRRQHPLPVGVLEPRDIGKTVKFLCSEDAALVSGEAIDVSAGRTANWPT
ncbi:MULTISPECIES: SDR family NAD(P)-dependent oxidoreductase [unclassified Pseudovibrio]|uniref:SDR family NAD(P)-dependent oxidoreductase n=1 Tax=unclassified Pseudovibrio TaxID=2627060 RepID=UPI0007AE7C4B|nr:MULTISPECIES: SDR family NAD(P)-dependent oxidoreductase [unclassified Pseudovibrio]KZL02606.1 (-)-trans-carveol dehydrogenase [Pseudovibrio sp. W74]KZL07851.1 (-)-trans-carveol dehydrogenase [Pseudovibrio sp. Ad14]